MKGDYTSPFFIVGRVMLCDVLRCPECGADVKNYRNPVPTVDIIIEIDGGIVLIERRNSPFGWALPGGFVDYGETLEAAAIREAREETQLEISNLQLLGCYSAPDRDSRQHTISTVFIAVGGGIPQAADDALDLKVFPLESVPGELCFDHAAIIADYAKTKLL